MHKIPNSNASNRGSLLRCRAAGFLQAHRFAVLASVVLFTAAAGLAPRVFAAPPVQVREPVSFDLAGSCVSVPVHGDGTSYMVITDRVDASGVHHLQINNAVTGHATDSAGGTYAFNYQTHASVNEPSSGYPVTAIVIDHFNLVGNGGDNNLQIRVVYRVTVLAPGVFDIEMINARGNPDCDPL
jgi:hypothetical protein